MLKVSHKALITISGMIWFSIGFWLLQLGLNFLMQSESSRGDFPLLNFLSEAVGSRTNGVFLIIIMGLMAGFFKGRVVLAKSVKKGVERILAMPNPSSLFKVYNLKYYILLAGMMGLGMLARFLPIDIRGFVDVAIGSALLNGAMLYFRSLSLVVRGAA